MIVAGLEAAEEVFLTLDSQQQLEAFVSDGEAVEAGKVIARMVGFADVLISAERVALNLCNDSPHRDAHEQVCESS